MTLNRSSSAFSTLQTRWLYCVEWTQYSIRLQAVRYMYAICNRCFTGLTRVLDSNGISIASAVFAGLTMWQTDRQTDRPRYSVGSNRRQMSITLTVRDGIAYFSLWPFLHVCTFQVNVLFSTLLIGSVFSYFIVFYGDSIFYHTKYCVEILTRLHSTRV